MTDEGESGTIADSRESGTTNNDESATGEGNSNMRPSTQQTRPGKNASCSWPMLDKLFCFDNDNHKAILPEVRYVVFISRFKSERILIHDSQNFPSI